MISKISVSIFAFLFYMSFLVPSVAALYYQDIYIYKNGWDEPFYLSYLGSLGNKDFIGYFQLYLVAFLHDLGIAGSYQNLIYDIIFPFLSLFFVYLTMKSLSRKRSFEENLLYSLLIIFSPIVFYSEFYVNLVSFFRSWDIIVSKISSLPLLRTMNPQFGYFSIAFTSYLYRRYQKIVILLLPLPFLYFFLLVPYLLFVGMFFVKNYFKNKNICFLIFVGAMLFLIGSFSLKFLFSHIYQNGYNPTHISLDDYSFQTSAAMIFMLFLMFFARENRIYIFMLFYSSVLSFNTQIISGFKVLPWCFEQYAYVPMLVLCIFLLISENIDLTSIRITMMLPILLLSCYLMFISENFSFLRLNWKIYNGANFNVDQIRLIKKFPMAIYFKDTSLAGRISYGLAKKPFLPFSYQYLFQSRKMICSGVTEYHERMLKELKDMEDKNHEMIKRMRVYDDFHTGDFCEKFFVDKFINLKPKVKTWLYFPSF